MPGAKPSGSIVSLACHTPGSISSGPETGDVLETSTGRRYLIIDRPPLGRDRCRYVCIVMDPADDYPPDSVRWDWTWSPRHRRRAVGSI